VLQRLLFFSLALLFSATVSVAQERTTDTNFPHYIDPSATYIWPTDASDYFSATFAETRSAHFHAAADIGTWGREGYEVYAARDGILFRIGISPHGYGNVIYLQHNDGSYSVYAHLQDFEPGIRAIVDSLRFETFEHSFDRIMTEYNLHFSQGDLIGRTGSTGIGPPHLHFELRSPNNAAFNPMLAGIHIADSVPPTFSSIAIVPKSGDALINGNAEMVTRTPSRSGNHFNFGRIDAEGTIGLAVNASDRSDNGRNVYAVYELEMKVNGEPLFHSRADSFYMGQSRQMLIDRVFPILQQRRAGYQRLHILPTNTLPFYNRDLGDGLLHLEPGTHKVDITALDFYGNKATASLEIRVPEKPAYQTPEVRFVYKAGAVSPPAPFSERTSPPHDHFEWNKHWIRPAGRAVQKLSIRSRGDFGRPVYNYESLNNRQTAPLSGEVVEISSEETGAFTLNRVLPGRETELRFPAHRMRLQFPEAAVFDTLYVYATRFTRNGEDFVRLAPGDEPLQQSFHLSMSIADSLADNQQLSLYYVNERNGARSAVSTTVEGNQLNAQARGFGLFVVAADTTPPQISRPRLWRRNSDQRWFVSVRAVDLQTGLDFNNAIFKVNGIRGIAEYDPFGHQLTYYLPGFEPVRGRNSITLELSDRAGNVSEFTHTFTH